LLVILVPGRTEAGWAGAEGALSKLTSTGAIEKNSYEENDVTHKYNAREKRKRRKAKVGRHKEIKNLAIAKSKEAKK
jgi:hypothetical protein